jgi:hypothetical protein
VKKALVVGINGYGFPNDLPSCTRDAEMFGNILEAVYRFDHVRVLKDGEATRDGVDRALEGLCQSATANDRLVVFFSGHGCRYEKNGVIEEALVLQDGRLLDGHHLADRTEHVPPGVLTIVVDASFSGLDETLIHPSGEIEISRAKRWIPTDVDRGRHERSLPFGTKAFTPFGHDKPVAPAAMAVHVRSGSSLDSPPARLTTAVTPQAKAVLVLPCLADETTTASTSQTNGLSPFTYCLINAIRRLGHNRSSIELLQATGYELRQLGLRQTPLLMEPAQPEHLGLRAFLTFQPVLFVYPSSTPGSEGEDELTRSIAEAVRSTLINIKEGRSMQATLPGGQTFLGEDFGTIVNTVTPIVASLLQGRAYQPHAGAGAFSPFGFGIPGSSGWMGSQGWWGGGFGQRGLHEEVGQIVGAVVPAILASFQSRAYQPYLPGFQPQPFQGGYSSFQGGHGFQGPMGPTLQPYEIAQIVSTVAPIVTSLIQSRSYQGHLGQFMPRAA